MLTQNNSSYSTQAFTPELNVLLTSVFLNDTSGKQNDNEVETFINYSPHADVHVCHSRIAEDKISLPTRPAFP